VQSKYYMIIYHIIILIFQKSQIYTKMLTYLQNHL